MDARERRQLASTFDIDAGGYHDGRPDYPEQAWDLVLAHADLGPEKVAVEVGAGTGQATARLLATGAAIRAVEPGASMCDRLRRRFAGQAFEVQTCGLEDAELDHACADAVLAATSFHWVDPDAGMSVIRRILRPSGALCLWWNVYRDPDNERVDAIDALVRESTARPNSRGLDGILAELDLPRRLQSAGFVGIEEHTVRWTGTHTEEELVSLFRSFSDMRLRHHTERDVVLGRLRMHVRDRGGTVTRPYTTPILLARAPG